jgi:hypothetical protein
MMGDSMRGLHRGVTFEGRDNRTTVEGEGFRCTRKQVVRCKLNVHRSLLEADVCGHPHSRWLIPQSLV